MHDSKRLFDSSTMKKQRDAYAALGEDLVAESQSRGHGVLVQEAVAFLHHIGQSLLRRFADLKAMRGGTVRHAANATNRGRSNCCCCCCCDARTFGLLSSEKVSTACICCCREVSHVEP